MSETSFSLSLHSLTPFDRKLISRKKINIKYRSESSALSCKMLCSVHFHDARACDVNFFFFSLGWIEEDFKDEFCQGNLLEAATRAASSARGKQRRVVSQRFGARCSVMSRVSVTRLTTYIMCIPCSISLTVHFREDQRSMYQVP